MHIEYAITNGKGILLDYGVAGEAYTQIAFSIAEDLGYDIISRPCSQDCQTGK